MRLAHEVVEDLRLRENLPPDEGLQLVEGGLLRRVAAGTFGGLEARGEGLRTRAVAVQLAVTAALWENERHLTGGLAHSGRGWTQTGCTFSHSPICAALSKATQ